MQHSSYISIILHAHSYSMRKFYLGLQLLVLILAGIFSSCSHREKKVKKVVAPRVAEFRDYWYSQGSEISSFALHQSKYGQLHHGEATLEYSLATYSRSRQLPIMTFDTANADHLRVMVLNTRKHFATGLFENSVASTTVIPEVMREGPFALKLTGSVHEREGLSWLQLNLDANKYNVQLRSFNANEGDINRVAMLSVTEDQLWCMIRTNPSALPVGKMRVIPGLTSMRLRQSVVKPVLAELTLTNALQSDIPSAIKPGAALQHYKIEYPVDGRRLDIFFQKDFPFLIEGWKETYVDGQGSNSRKTTTSAHRTQTIRSTNSGMIQMLNNDDSEEMISDSTKTIQP
jgi:hypothetical protein